MEHSKSIKIMGTDIILKIFTEKISTVTKNEIFLTFENEFKRIVKKFTRFDNTSELSLLNLNNGEWFEVSEELFFLVQYSYDLHKKTEGLFDPSVIDFLELYGYTNLLTNTEKDQNIIIKLVKNRAKSRPKFMDTEFDIINKKIKLPHDCRIEFGAFGKGYAIDCVHNKLKNISENYAFLINAGGDIKVHSNTLKQEWEVSLKTSKKNIGFIKLQNDEAICSSGGWIKKIRKIHHLINPKNGSPKNLYDTAFCKADNAMDADAWSSIIFLDGSKYIDKYKIKNIEYWVI